MLLKSHAANFAMIISLRPATLLKKRLWHRCFPVNFAKFLRTPFLTEHLWWLLLRTGNKQFAKDKFMNFYEHTSFSEFREEYLSVLK